LAEIGGGEAAGAVRRIIVEKIVQGSGLKSALQAAARLGVGLPVNVVVSLLRHEAPEIRAGGCRCARSPAVIRLLLELLDDPDHVVAREAACALDRMGGTDARPMLLRLLQQAPSAAVIDAISAIADEECLVILGRIARTGPDLVDVALEALDSIGTPPALKIAAFSPIARS
jgi:HEAT repeat protein